MRIPVARRRPLLIALAAAALIGLGVGWWLTARQAARNATRLTANGTIEAVEVEVGAQRAARLASYRVAEGQSVKAGNVIAVLDTSELSAQMEQARGTGAAAAARLAEILRGARPEELQQAQGQLQQARAGVSGGQRTLANARLAYQRRTALRQALDAAETQRDMAQAALRQAEAAEAGSEEALRTAEQEYETSIQLRQARDAARQQLEAAQASERAARAQLQQLLNGARVEEVLAARAQVGQAAAAVQAARAELANATTELARARQLHAGRALSDQQLEAAQTRANTADARLRQAQQTQEQAEARLAQLLNGARPEEIDAAQAAVQQAQATVEGGRHALENAQQAYELRLGARAQLEGARTQREVARAQTASSRAARAGADLAVRNARTAYTDALQEKQSTDTALQQYGAALGQLDAAAAQLDLLRNGATREQIAQVRGQVRQARGALDLARVQLEQSVIRAPVDGVLTEHVAEVGEVVTPGATVARVVQLDNVYLTLYVPEPEIEKVKLGQRADVLSDAGKVYRGHVTLISDTPEFTPRNVQTRDERVKLVFQVKVDVENPRRELKPGLPVDAVIYLR